VELTEHQLREVLAEYLTLLQRHPSAEEMMEAILTDDFETGFEGGFTWRGIDGLRDFLSQRAGFFDEKHEVKDVLEMSESADGTRRTRGSSSSCAAGRRPRRRARSSRAPAFTTGDSAARPIAGAWPPRWSSASPT
jgi:hypothetical protein